MPLGKQQITKATGHTSLLPIRCLALKLCLNQRATMEMVRHPHTKSIKLTCLLFGNQDQTLIIAFYDTLKCFYPIPCQRTSTVDHPKEIFLKIKLSVILSRINWEIKFSKFGVAFMIKQKKECSPSQINIDTLQMFPPCFKRDVL